jgi:hypothetical protein
MAPKSLGKLKAEKTLPLCPGDLICFTASGKRLFVVVSSDQQVRNGLSGQHVYGMLAHADRTWAWDDFWLAWSGYSSLWTIHRKGLYDEA